MLAHLAKLAARSSQLRKVAMKKEAIGLGTAANLGMGALAIPSGVAGARGKYRESMAGFNPQVQQAMKGQAPTPPGVG